MIVDSNKSLFDEVLQFYRSRTAVEQLLVFGSGGASSKSDMIINVKIVSW